MPQRRISLSAVGKGSFSLRSNAGDCGPEYDAPENLERLRSHGLGKKRLLALRKFALAH